VRAVCDLQPGSLICEYTGESLNQVQFTKRRSAPGSKSYLMRAGSAVVDASRRGNAARFINHSCNPCAEVQVWSMPAAGGRSQRTAVGIFACRLIKAGEEITYDYRFEAFGDGGEIACECCASRCRGMLGKRKLACTQFAA
jgi:SET domain-containing protein